MHVNSGVARGRGTCPGRGLRGGGGDVPRARAEGGGRIIRPIYIYIFEKNN